MGSGLGFLLVGSGWVAASGLCCALCLGCGLGRCVSWLLGLGRVDLYTLEDMNGGGGVC